MLGDRDHEGPERPTRDALGDTALPGAGDVEAAELPPQGLSWSWELDFEAVLAALNEPAPWNRAVRPDAGATDAGASDAGSTAGDIAADQDVSDSEGGQIRADAAEIDAAEAELAELLEAIDEGRSRVMPLEVVAGRVAESLPTGPDLAGWLAISSADGLEDGALAGVAASYRRLASWAQAGELAMVAQMASRSAAADDKIGVDEQGRPARLPDEACAQVSLALTMSQSSASWWSDLGVTLRWRLAATGAALRAGQIDLSRARLIAEATGLLDDDTARVVEARVLPAAGGQTTAQLRAALRRAVIAADPRGAERRREEAERRAKVCLYPDAEGTASLAGYSLPSIRAAAAMGRVSALARAMKASGAGGGIDLLRAQVFLGLLLGTLPYIPPAPDGPPDDAPHHDGSPSGSSGGTPDQPSGGLPDQPSGGPSGDQDPCSASAGAGGRGRRRSGPSEGSAGRPAAGGQGSAGGMGPAVRDGVAPGPGGPGAGAPGPGGPDAGAPGPGGPDADARDPDDPGPAAPGQDDAGEDDRNVPCPDDPYGRGDSDELWPASRPPPAWPGLTAFVQPGPAAMGNLRPAGGGLLDLRLPWTTLAGESAEPGFLSRIGPVTPAQACHLADLAACDPDVTWRIIVTGPDGRAVAVTRVPRESARAGPATPTGPAKPTGPGAGGSGGQAREDPSSAAGLVGRVTVTIAQDNLCRPPPQAAASILARTLRAAGTAADRAADQAAADADAAGGCAHTRASLAYRPPTRLQEHVTARDVTCRFPTCRQPAWRSDLDHTTPYDQGGKTCSCNLGGLCRFHHQLKQYNRWQLTQPVPGTFTWTTPTGRTYITDPDIHPV